MSSSLSSTEQLTSNLSDSPPGSPVPRKRLKRHVDNKYQREWSGKYRMNSSSLGDTFAHCKMCKFDFSVAGGGVHQVKGHCESKRHVLNMKGVLISQHFTKQCVFRN